MAIINIDSMYREMINTMKNNFQGTPRQIYSQAKKQFLESVSDSIEDNKEDLIKEVEDGN